MSPFALRPGVRLALDWGTARIGVAACDRLGTLAYPVETIARASDLAGLFTPSDAIAPASLRVALGDAAASGVPYVRAVQSLDEAVKADGTAWLAAIVTGLRSASADLAPGLGLFASLSTAAG